jgi:hypothetical protein
MLILSKELEDPNGKPGRKWPGFSFAGAWRALKRELYDHPELAAMMEEAYSRSSLADTFVRYFAANDDRISYR